MVCRGRPTRKPNAEGLASKKGKKRERRSEKKGVNRVNSSSPSIGTYFVGCLLLVVVVVFSVSGRTSLVAGWIVDCRVVELLALVESDGVQWEKTYPCLPSALLASVGLLWSVCLAAGPSAHSVNSSGQSGKFPQFINRTNCNGPPP